MISFDAANKLAILSAGTTTLSVRDLWSRWVDWWLTSSNSGIALTAMAQVGGNDIDAVAGTKIPIFVFLQNGWRVRPQEANHTLNVTDGVLLVDGGGDPFVNTVGSYVVRINYQQPVQAIAFVSNAGGGLSGAQATQLSEIHQRLGLEVGTPLEQTTNSIIAGDILLTVEEVDGTVTVERI